MESVLGLEFGFEKEYTKSDTVLDTVSDEDCFEKGNELYAEGEYKEAIRYYKKHLENHSYDYVCCYNIGVSYNKLKDDNTALKYLFKAKHIIEKDIQNSSKNTYCNVLFNIGVVYYYKEDKRKALSYLKKAKNIKPQDMDCINAIRKVKCELNID